MESADWLWLWFVMEYIALERCAGACGSARTICRDVDDVFGVGSKRDGMKRNLGEGVHDLYSP